MNSWQELFKMTKKLYLVFGRENHPDGYMEIVGVSDNEDLAKRKVERINQNPTYQKRVIECILTTFRKFIFFQRTRIDLFRQQQCSVSKISSSDFFQQKSSVF